MSAKIARNVDSALDAAIKKSQGDMVAAIDKLHDDILRLISRLEVDPDGTIRGPTVTVATLTRIQTQIVKLFADTYGKAALRHIRRLPTIANLVERVYEELGAQAVDFTEVNEEGLSILARQDYQLHVSLSKETQARISRAVFSHALGYGNIKELEKEISGILVGHEDVRGRPLSTYAKTYAQDQIMQYHATANQMLGEQSDVEKWWYVGDRIETSRDFCIRNRGKTRTTEEWYDLGVNTEWQGKSCNQIFVCRGGYNCRHHFQPVIE